MIGDSNIETQQRRHRSEEAFRLPQTEVIDGTNSQRSLDGEVRIDAPTVRLSASGRVPRFNCFFGKSKRQLATLLKGGFVRRPITNPIGLLRILVLATLRIAVWHRVSDPEQTGVQDGSSSATDPRAVHQGIDETEKFTNRPEVKVD